MNHAGTRNRSGFTLIELIVVIGVITVLASVILVAFKNVRVQSQTKFTKAILNMVRQSIVSYKDFNHKMPVPDQMDDMPANKDVMKLLVEPNKNGMRVLEGIEKKQFDANDNLIDPWEQIFIFKGIASADPGKNGKLVDLYIFSMGPDVGETISGDAWQEDTAVFPPLPVSDLDNDNVYPD